MDKTAGKASWIRSGAPLRGDLWVPVFTFTLDLYQQLWLDGLLGSSDLLHPPTSVSLASLGPGVSLDDNRQKTPVPLVGTPSAYVSPTTMAHHLDSPIARQDVRLDITDLYLFRGETGTVFVINVCHSIAGDIPTPG
jgi:hypothetical protein